MKVRVLLFAGSCVMAASGAVAAPSADAAIQAVKQAADPSAAIAAYANGFAQDRNDPRLYDAFVNRMVDLGLPELAYHQAQTLTTLEANNGVAWGVVAYVDARRSLMPEAVSAVNLAGQFAPDSKFVQRTAGELVAWYDFKADKAKIPDPAKDGLVKIRGALGKRSAFTEAYSTAHKAYENEAATPSEPSAAASNQPVPAPAVSNAAQASAPTPASVAPQALGGEIAPLGYVAPPPAPAYYYPAYSGIYLDWGPSYCFDWGPGWVAPAPWWWWRPCGFWGGCNFFPFEVSFVFCDFDDFHRFHHHGFFDRDDRFGHHDRFGHRGDGMFWHRDAKGRNGFFGAPARASASSGEWARASFQGSPASARTVAAARSSWWSGTAQPGHVHGYMVPRPPVPAARSFAGQHVVAARRPNWTPPSYRAPVYSAPRYVAPSRGSFGAYGGWHGSVAMSAPPRSFGGGSSAFHGGGSFGGGFRGGSVSHGFHGDGFGGGGFSGHGRR